MGLACPGPVGRWAAVGLPPDEGQPGKRASETAPNHYRRRIAKSAKSNNVLESKSCLRVKCDGRGMGAWPRPSTLPGSLPPVRDGGC